MMPSRGSSRAQRGSVVHPERLRLPEVHRSKPAHSQHERRRPSSSSSSRSDSSRKPRHPGRRRTRCSFLSITRCIAVLGVGGLFLLHLFDLTPMVIDAQQRLSSHAPSAGLSSHEAYLDDEEYERAALDSLAAQDTSQLAEQAARHWAQGWRDDGDSGRGDGDGGGGGEQEESDGGGEEELAKEEGGSEVLKEREVADELAPDKAADDGEGQADARGGGAAIANNRGASGGAAWRSGAEVLTSVAQCRAAAAAAPAAAAEEEEAEAEAGGRAVAEGFTAGAPLDVTMITQASAERLWMLPFICDRWAGTLVVAALAAAADRRKWPPLTVAGGDEPRCRALLLELQPPGGGGAEKKGYPINWLRNQAIGCVATSHYLIADIDFWPSRELRRLIRMQLPAWGEAQRALVVPNFQRSGHGCRASGPSACRDAFERGSLAVPSNYSELATCARARQCAVFDSEYNAAGQASTDIHAWRGLAEGSTMPISCFSSVRYEPFVVLRNHAATPRFDERFTGYGKNKVQLILHLRMAGYAFHVLGRGFLCHFPHPQSSSKQAWLHSSAHAAMDRLFHTFEAEMRSRYSNATLRTRMCP